MSLHKKIGRYHVIGRIASGGMAEILLAKVLGPGGFERPVVIKRVLPHLVNETEFRDMFLDEARIVAAIQHHNVVQVHELGREDDELYLVMEYLAGESIRSLCTRAAARNIRLDLGLCAHVIAESCAGLHAAHEFTDPDGKPLHVVHRDVCPNNLFVTYDGTVKVVDFGIAQAADRFTLTEAGQVKGKAAYMSPEQCLRRPVDRRTDVFALGVVLYELTTGHRLFGGALESRLISCLQREEVQPPSRVVPDYPSELERICIRALRFDPEERFASAEEMRRALVRFQRSLTSDVLPEEQLTACMRDLFRDRVEEKAELLSRLRAGTGISYIPTAEVSDEVSVPVVETERNRDHLPLLSVSDDPVDVLAATSAGYDTTRGRRRGLKRRSRGLMLTAILTILASAGLGSLFYIADPALGARDARPQHTPQTASPGAIPTNAPVAPVPEQVVVAPVPEQVMVELTSLPPGAGAWLDGVYQGDTPLAVVLARGTEALSLRLQLSGHETLEQALVPDVDQRLTLSLAPSVRAQPPLRGATAGDRKPTEAKSSEAPESEALAAERDQQTSEKASRKKPSTRRHPTGSQTEERDEFFLFE